MILGNIVLLIVLLVGSAIFSGTEAAYLSVDRNQIRALKKQNRFAAGTVEKLLRKREKVLALLLILNNITNIGIATVSTLLVVQIASENNTWYTLLGVAITTIVVVIFTEFTPKTFATTYATGWTITTATMLDKMILIFRPFIWIMELLPNLIQKLLPPNDKALDSGVTSSTIRSLIDIGEEQGLVEASKGQMLENVFRFDEIAIAKIMTPISEIVTVKSTDSISGLLETYRQFSHSRFPVIDNHGTIIGIVSIKDALLKLGTSTTNFDILVKEILRLPLEVIETTAVSKVFRQMIESGDKIVIIYDEHGGVSGLVTLTKIAGQVVGPLDDDGGRRVVIAKEKNNAYIISADASIEDLKKELNIEIEEGDYQTLAGYFLYIYKNVPSINSQVETEKLKLQICKLKNHKIVEIKLTIK